MDSNGKPSTSQILLLATSSALTALLYSVYRKKASSAARLRVSKAIFEIYSDKLMAELQQHLIIF